MLQAVRQAEAATAVVEIYQTMAVTAMTFCRRKEPCGGLDVSELKELREPWDEIRWPNSVVAATRRTCGTGWEGDGKAIAASRRRRLGSGDVPHQPAAGLPRMGVPRPLERYRSVYLDD